MEWLHQQLHGYRNGHQLLHSTTCIRRRDQDLIDQLSDIAGPLRPGQNFDPYISAYPLPSSEYYVFSRTVQDHAAPRAGCVITNSLLVPLTYWERGARPAELLGILECLDGEDAVPISQVEQGRTLEPISSPLLTELVEALLLRKRWLPVVVFDASDPILISLRLLTAFWPGIRSEFSLCTFALSPRSLSGKAFNLVFAPEAARRRFSDWEGQRIGPSYRTDSDRHRWVKQIQTSIFQDTKPTLLPAKLVRALGGHENEESEKFLRLLILWQDLQERASNSPVAVLGLIDIAKSRGVLIERFLEPEICNAIEIATKKMQVVEAWDFLGTLMGKLSGRELSQDASETLHSGVDRLIQREWKPALEFLIEGTWSGQAGSRQLAEVAAGRLASVESPELNSNLVLVPSDVMVQILLLDDRLLASALADKGKTADSFVDRIIEGFRVLNKETRMASAMRVLTHIQGEHQNTLVTEIISDMKSKKFIEAVELVWKERGIRGAKLADIFCDAAITRGVDEEVRTVFSDISGDEDTDHCIVRLMKPRPKDIKWVLENSIFDEHRKIRLLRLFVENVSEEDLETAFSNREMAGEVLNMFMRNIEEYRIAAARLLILSSFTHGEKIEKGLKLYAYLKPVERGMLSQCIAIGIFLESGKRNATEIEAALKIVLPDLDMLEVIEDLFGADNDGTMISGLLDKIEESKTYLRSSLEQYGLRIVKLIAERNEFDLTASGALSLAKFIKRAKTRDENTHIQMCSSVLPFAMSGRDMSASLVIMETFPTVHNGLEEEGEYFGFLRFFILPDWDRARKLRKKLVRAYMNSNWPPVHLAVAGLEAKALRRILKLVTKEPGGEKFLDEIECGAKGTEKDVRRKILKKIKEIRKSSGFIFESET
ncbi:MAG: hypothetical protein OXD44_00455 [Gammaproteobacteria bacterium]|nr:hypothetical protein [Gammaproteobacteria bacterium]